MFAVGIGSGAAGCGETVPDPKSTPQFVTPNFLVKNVQGYGETALGPPPDTAYGWGLEVKGGIAHWRECVSSEECSRIERQCPTSELLAFSRLGRISLDDGEMVDVLSLSFTPRARYIVPPR